MLDIFTKYLLHSFMTCVVFANVYNDFVEVIPRILYIINVIEYSVYVMYNHCVSVKSCILYIFTDIYVCVYAVTITSVRQSCENSS